MKTASAGGMFRLVACLAATLACDGYAADDVTALGTVLTAVGAETAGSADGAIPPYTGALLPPAGYRTGDGRRIDPFADEKPVRVITPASAAGAGTQLTDGTRELLRRHPGFRIDVYPSHRTVGYPDYILENTRRNATTMSTAADRGISKALPGVPFPIPRDGNEVMWNHRMRCMGRAIAFQYESWLMTSGGLPVLTSSAHSVWDFPVFDAKRAAPLQPDEILFQWKVDYTGPQRRAGESLLLFDAVDPLRQARRVWSYLPGQRRARQVEMPDDAPHGSSSGAYVNDDAFVYTGVLERFDVKLLGKREMIIPYNTYRFSYHPKVDDLLQPGHLNPDYLRWELHRVWVVEATLKPGEHHVYGRRVFYVDEDSWTALAADEYETDGRLRRTVFAFLSQSYDAGVPFSINHAVYDFGQGSYFLAFFPGAHSGVKYVQPLPSSQWTPDAMAGAGVR